jgi:hypothetical protein
MSENQEMQRIQDMRDPVTLESVRRGAEAVHNTQLICPRLNPSHSCFLSGRYIGIYMQHEEGSIVPIPWFSDSVTSKMRPRQPPLPLRALRAGQPQT